MTISQGQLLDGVSQWPPSVSESTVPSSQSEDQVDSGVSSPAEGNWQPLFSCRVASPEQLDHPSSDQNMPDAFAEEIEAAQDSPIVALGDVNDTSAVRQPVKRVARVLAEDTQVSQLPPPIIRPASPGAGLGETQASGSSAGTASATHIDLVAPSQQLISNLRRKIDQRFLAVAEAWAGQKPADPPVPVQQSLLKYIRREGVESQPAAFAPTAAASSSSAIIRIAQHITAQQNSQARSASPTALTAAVVSEDIEMEDEDAYVESSQTQVERMLSPVKQVKSLSVVLEEEEESQRVGDISIPSSDGEEEEPFDNVQLTGPRSRNVAAWVFGSTGML